MSDRRREKGQGGGKAAYELRQRQRMQQALQKQTARQGSAVDQVALPCTLPWVLDVRVKSLTKGRWPRETLTISARKTSGVCGDQSQPTKHNGINSSIVTFRGRGGTTYELTTRAKGWELVASKTQSVPYDGHVVILEIRQRAWIKLHVIDITETAAPVAFPGCRFQTNLPGPGDSDAVTLAEEAMEIIDLDPGTAKLNSLTAPVDTYVWMVDSVDSV